MPSSRDSRSPSTVFPAPDHEAAIRIVSDRLTSGRKPLAAGQVPEPLASRSSVEIPHESLIPPAAMTEAAEFLPPKSAASDLGDPETQVAWPTDRAGGSGSATPLEVPGRLVGSDGPSGMPSGGLLAGETGNSRRGDPLRGDTVPVVAASGGFGAANRDLSRGPEAAGVESEAGGPSAAAPAVRGAKLAPVPDYAVAEPVGADQRHDDGLRPLPVDLGERRLGIRLDAGQRERRDRSGGRPDKDQRTPGADPGSLQEAKCVIGDATTGGWFVFVRGPGVNRGGPTRFNLVCRLGE